MLILTLGLAGLLSSPDVPPVTIATWAKLAPADFLATAASELDGTSKTATYGPPYDNGTGSVQRLLFSPQTWPGITQPVDAASDFVIAPLSKAAAGDPRLATALSAPSSQCVLGPLSLARSGRRDGSTCGSIPFSAHTRVCQCVKWP